MVFVEAEEVAATISINNNQAQKCRKSLVLSERDLDKFETILTSRQHRRKDSKSTVKNFRNSSLDDSYLTFITSNNIRPDRILQQSNSIAANLNDHICYPYEDKLNEFADIKNNLKISASSSESNSVVVGPSSDTHSLNSLENNKHNKTSSNSSINESSKEIDLSNAQLDVIGLNTRSKLLSSLSSDLDGEDDECQLSDDDDDDDQSSYLSRKESAAFKKDALTNRTLPPTDIPTITPTNIEPVNPAPSIVYPSSGIAKSNDSINHAPVSRKQSSISCEVASLSSMTSNYSQFEFLTDKQQKHRAPSPPEVSSASRSSSITSFFFSNSLFKSNRNNSKQQPSIPESPKPETSSNKFDLITSRLLNLTTANSSSAVSDRSNLLPAVSAMPYSLHSSSSSLSNPSSNNNDTQSIKSNVSSQNLNGLFLSSSSSVSNDLKTLPSSVLIFENRPSNLPAKSQQEALKHKLEYEKMVEAAKRKELKEHQVKFKKYEQQIKKEDFMTNSLRIWNTEILTNWKREKDAKRTKQLWWHGLPPSIRGKVWKLAIGNDLNLTKETYFVYKQSACDKHELLSKNSKCKVKMQESSIELIKLDVARTFPQLCFFQREGPYHEALHSVLGAYACFNPKIGYVQGMSFLTAILLLNMEAHDAFVCLANLLDMKYLLACFCMDQIKMNRYFRVHEILLEHNLPKLYKHFKEQNVKPDLYLIEWVFTLFSKSLPLDVMSRVWDVFFRDKEEFLFRTALGILSMYKETLLEMDFIHIVQFLTKLPENINATHLFKAIEQISTNIDESYFTFDQLLHRVVVSPDSQRMGGL